MEQRQYQQGLFDLKAYLLDQCRNKRYVLTDVLRETYSQCRTREDRLEFLRARLDQFAFQLESNLETNSSYENLEHFCEVHLMRINLKRKRFPLNWYLKEYQHIAAYIEQETLKLAISWLKDRINLQGAKTNRQPHSECQLHQLATLTIVPPELIPMLSLKLGQYLTASSRPYLQRALEGGKPSQALVIANQTNRFVDAFAQLIEAGIVQEKKQQVRDWLVEHFVQIKGDNQETLRFSSVWDYLSKRAKKPTNPVNILQAIGWQND